MASTQFQNLELGSWLSALGGWSAITLDPSRTLLLTHEKGLQVSASLGRVYRNQLEHDPMNIDRAREIASAGDPIPVGILYQNPAVPCYEELRSIAPLRTPELIRRGLEALLAAYRAREWDLEPRDEDVHSAVERRIDAFPAGQIQKGGLHGLLGILRGIQCEGGSQLLGQLETVVADVDRDNRRGSRDASDGDGQQSGRAAPGDEDGPAGQALGEGGVHGIAQRLLDAGELWGKFARGLPEDAFRQLHIVGVGAVHVDPKNAIVLAHVSLSRSALKAASTREVRFGRDVVSHGDQRDRVADRHHFSAHFMPDDPWRLDSALGPVIPPIDMGVRAADGRGSDTNHDFSLTGRRVGHRFKSQAGSRSGFDKRAHEKPSLG